MLSERSPTKSNATPSPPPRPFSQNFSQKTSESKTLPNYVHLTFTATFLWYGIKLSVKINWSLCGCKSEYLMLYKVGKLGKYQACSVTCRTWHCSVHYIQYIPQGVWLLQIRISSGLVMERSFQFVLDRIAFPWCPSGSDIVPWLVHSSSRTSHRRHTRIVCIQRNSRPIPRSQARWNRDSVFILVQVTSQNY